MKIRSREFDWPAYDRTVSSSHPMNRIWMLHHDQEKSTKESDLDTHRRWRWYSKISSNLTDRLNIKTLFFSSADFFHWSRRSSRIYIKTVSLTGSLRMTMTYLKFTAEWSIEGRHSIAWRFTRESDVGMFPVRLNLLWRITGTLRLVNVWSWKYWQLKPGRIMARWLDS